MEVSNGEQFGMICDDDWTDMDAHTVCRDLFGRGEVGYAGTPLVDQFDHCYEHDEISKSKICLSNPVCAKKTKILEECAADSLLCQISAQCDGSKKFAEVRCGKHTFLNSSLNLWSRNLDNTLVCADEDSPHISVMLAFNS